jgi:hypothetical protein
MPASLLTRLTAGRIAAQPLLLRPRARKEVANPRVRVQPRIQDLTPSSVQDEKKMEPELDAVAKELQKLNNQICPEC